MGRKFKRILFYFIGVTLLIVIVLLIFSPFKKLKGEKYRTIQYSIEINANVDTVFTFMGKSKMASKWSVFVDEIKPLNGDDFPDGTVGSIRRCFAHPLKNNQQWDEEISIVENNKKRQLIIYNLVNFPLVAEGLLTEQLYDDLGINKSKLTLTLFFKNDTPSNWNWFKTKLSAYQIKSIFKQNLINIKRIIERK